MPAELGGAGFPIGAVAQKENGGLGCLRPKAEAPASGEIEDFGRTAYFRHDGGDGPAAQCLLGGPEQLHHVGGPHDHQLLGRNAQGEQPRPIGQAQFLGLLGELEVNHHRALPIQQVPPQPQGKAQARAAVAGLVREDFLNESGAQHGKPVGFLRKAHRGLAEGGLALDLGNSVPQRLEALLAK